VLDVLSDMKLGVISLLLDEEEQYHRKRFSIERKV
jgi:hypothetical protein